MTNVCRYLSINLLSLICLIFYGKRYEMNKLLKEISSSTIIKNTQLPYQKGCWCDNYKLKVVL